LTAQHSSLLLHRAAPLVATYVAALACVAACTERPSLTIAERTGFVSELIAERVECNVFREQLTVPAKDVQALNAVYEAAKTAYCLKPDV
jgi:hypothetical protein